MNKPMFSKEQMLTWLKFERIMSEKERSSHDVIKLIDAIYSIVEQYGDGRPMVTMKQIETWGRELAVLMTADNPPYSPAIYLIDMFRSNGVEVEEKK